MVRFLTKPFSPVCLKHKVFTAVNPWKLSRTGTSFNAQQVREPACSSQEFTSVRRSLQVCGLACSLGRTQNRHITGSAFVTPSRATRLNAQNI